jgi:predicted RNA methylase
MAERALTAKKVRGAYYTDPRVVEFLVAWGTSVAPGTVMDPSCGDGRFLEAAARHGAIAVIGCDIDGEALHQAGQPLMGARASVRFERSDFFSLEPSRFSGVDLVVGNPPFIRFQHFSGESRAKALRSALRVGGRLSRLTASWAPFLLHALQFLRVGGAMAMVVPAELAQTAYGVATLQALCANFGRVRLITFRRNWFEDAQQETFLLLASDRGGSCRSAELIPLGTIEELISGHALLPDSPQLEMAPDANMTIGLAFLDAEVRAIWATVCADDRVTSLAGLGDVANGYVSGANDFFHRTREQAHTSGIPVVWLVPAARSIRSLRGLDFAMADIEANESAGIAHHLVLPRSDDLFSADPRALDRFVAEGERLGLHRRYKCRSRSPWWQVPGLIAAQCGQ